MTIKAFNAGPLALTEVRAEFGGPTTGISMFAYRSGGPYVPVGTLGYPKPSGTPTLITSFPTNGDPWNFSLNGFYGASAVVAPTYSVSPSTLSANEGTTITFNVTTTNVPNGTTLYWVVLLGTTNNADYTGLNYGTFTINSNAGSFILPITADLLTEGAETFAMRISASGWGGPYDATSATITINDTSLTPANYTYTETVSSNLLGGYNLRDRALSTSPRYGSNLTNGTSWNGSTPLIATVTVNSGVYVVGTTSTPAFATGTSFPVDSSLTLVNNGIIAGGGGAGGLGAAYSDSTLTRSATPGGNGGTALSVSYPMNVYNNGTIGGGGGGGGGAGAAYWDLSYDDNPGGGVK